MFNTKSAGGEFSNADDRQKISAVVPILWEEHCVECAMPTCYGTCLMYQKRMDGGRCVRFENGVVPYVKDADLYSEIMFRRWAKLEAALPEIVTAMPLNNYFRRERRFRTTGRLLRKICDVIHYHRFCRIYSVLTDRSLQKYKGQNKPDGFFLQIFLFDKEKRHLNIEAYCTNVIYFKTSLELMHGWNETFIPWDRLHLEDNIKGRRLRLFFDANETAHVVFKYADLVKWEETKSLIPASKVKCVAWDLDNTLWQGVIGDDGPEGVTPNQECLEMIAKLDKMGVLQTIVSKNEEEIAMSKLEVLGIKDYFLYPAINWGRKSENLKSIAKELNINIDTFAFIDDQPFERDEVKSCLPQVRVYDVKDVPSLLDGEEFNLPITEESGKRRLSYQNEYKRKLISASWDGDYESFLKSCQLRMNIFKPTSEADISRSLELVMRSNQYNISGRRYSVEDFKNEILYNDKYDCYSFKVSDNFGDYGLVGFASFEKKDNRYIMHDFVMSCRVAQKTVEHAFLSTLFEMIGEIYNEVIIPVKKTERNKPLRNVFLSLPLKKAEDNDESLMLIWNVHDEFPCNNIIEVVYE